MALSIGEVNFALGAETANLQAASASLRAFQQHIDTVQASITRQTTATRAASTAYNRQEEAVRRAIKETSDLQKQIQQQVRSQAQANTLISQSNKFLSDFTTRMTSGALAARQFNENSNIFRNSLSQLRHELAGIKSDRLGQLGNVLREIQGASVLALGPLSGIASRLTAFNSLINTSSVSVTGFVVGLTAAAVGVGALAAGAIDAAKQYEKMDSSLMQATGSADASRMIFNDLVAINEKYSGELVQSTIQFSKLAAAARGTSLGLGDLETLYEGLIAATSSVKLSTDDTAGAFRAFLQIVSKGKVQAEEFTQQFGERVPGATQVAADAFGLTTGELLKLIETGTLTAEMFVKTVGPALVKAFGEQGAKAGESLTGSLNDLTREVFLFNHALDETLGISEGYESFIDATSTGLKYLRQNMNTVIAALGALAGATAGFFALNIARGFIAIGAAIRTVTVAIWAMNAAILANPVGALAALLARVAVAIAGSVLGFKLLEGAMADAGQTQQQYTERVDETVRALKNHSIAAKEVADKLVEESNREIAAREAAIAKLEEQRKALQDQRDEASTPAMMAIQAGLSGGFDTGNSWLSELESQLVDNQQEIDRLNKELDAYRQGIQQVGQAATEAGVTSTTAFKNIRTEVGNLTQSLIDTQAALKLTQQGSGALEAVDRFQILTDAVDKARKSIDKMDRDQLKAVDESLRLTGVNVEDAKTEFGKFGITLTDNELKVAALVLAQMTANDALKEWINSTKEAQSSTKRLSETVASMVTDLQASRMALAQAGNQSSENAAKIGQEFQAISSAFSQVNSLMSKGASVPADLAQQVAKLGLDVEGTKKRFAAFGFTLGDSEAQLAALILATNDAGKAISGLGKDAGTTDFQKSLDNAKSTVSGLQLQLENLQKVKDLQLNVTGSGLDKITAVDSLQELIQAIDQAKQATKGLSAEGLAELSASIDTSGLDVAGIAAQIQQFGLNTEGTSAEVIAMTKAIMDSNKATAEWADNVKKADDAQKAAARSARQLIDNVSSWGLTPAQDFQHTVEATQKAVQELNDQGLALTTEEVERLNAGLNALDPVLQEKIRLAQEVGESFSEAFKSMIVGSKSVGEAISDLGMKIADLILQAAIFTPLEKAITSSVGSYFGNSYFADGAAFGSSGVKGYKDGGAFSSTGIQAFASGDIFSRPTMFQFGANQLGVMGEAGTEAVMPLERGSDGKLGVNAYGLSQALLSSFDASSSLSLGSMDTSNTGVSRQSSDAAQVIADAITELAGVISQFEVLLSGYMNSSVFSTTSNGLNGSYIGNQSYSAIGQMPESYMSPLTANSYGAGGDLNIYQSVNYEIDARDASDAGDVETRVSRAIDQALAQQLPALSKAVAAQAMGMVKDDIQRRGGRI